MSTDNPSNFRDWHALLDEICKREFLVDTTDMGCDLVDLRRYFNDGETPEEVSDYFARKFNLTRAAEVWLGG